MQNDLFPLMAIEILHITERLMTMMITTTMVMMMAENHHHYHHHHVASRAPALHPLFFPIQKQTNTLVANS